MIVWNGLTPKSGSMIFMYVYHFPFNKNIFILYYQYLQTKPERKSYGECKAILSKDTLLINKKKSNIDEIKIKYIKRVSRQHDVIKFSTKKHFDEKKKHIITSEKAAEFVEKLLFLKERNRLKKKALTIQGYKSQVHKQKKKRHSEISNMRIKSKDENIIDLESSDKDQCL